MILPLLCLAAAAAQNPQDLRIESRALAIRLGAASRGAVESVVDRSSGRDFIAGVKPSPLFRFVVADAAGKLRALTTADAASWEPSRSGDQIVLRYRSLGGQDFHVECRVRLGASDTLSHWNIAVDNRSPWSIRFVQYPVVQAAPQLGPEWNDDRVLSPVHDLRYPQDGPNHFPAGGRAIYPGRAQVQFVAYYDDAAGLYLATYDNGGHPKRLGFDGTAERIDLTPQHEIWSRPGEFWKMPYDVVVGTFHGDWHAAADIYKAWAVQQPWCARKLTERSDIPRWYLEGRPVVMFIPRGGEFYAADKTPRTPDRYLTRPVLPEPGLRPRAPVLFAEVSRALRSPLIIVEYGWEKHGAWISPDVFPPYGGNDSFREQFTALRRNGHIGCAYLSGTRWGVTKAGRPDYDGWPALKRDAPDALVTGPDQQPVVDHSPWASNARLCMGSPVTRKLMLDVVRGLVERGVPFVPYDQNLGGEVYECHNRAHAHPPGYGTWMAARTREFFAEARKLGRSLDPDFAMTIEEPCEYFIQDVDGFNDRPYVTGRYGESVPLFSYLYHEYQLSFGGDSPLGVHCPEADLVRIARSFMAGMLVEGPSFGTSREWPKEELEFLAAIVHAQRTFARPYAILGTMLPAPKLERVPMLDGALVGGSREVPISLKPVRIPAVLASAWKSPAGRTAYLLANASGEGARPLLLVEQAGSWVRLAEDGREKLTPRNGRVEVRLGPRQVALVERE